jgi:bifunctional non-homologous end joining protein LigD
VARLSERPTAADLPEWIRPQLTQLVKDAPEGPDWLHEIKFDGYLMHARLDRGRVRLLTRNGLDWRHKYPALTAALSALNARKAYLDGEFCGVYPDGITSFGMIQTASDAGHADGLVYFIFDLLHLDGKDLSALPLIERKARLALCCQTPVRHCTTAIITGETEGHSIDRPAHYRSRALSRNAPMPRTRPAIAACGLK